MTSSLDLPGTESLTSIFFQGIKIRKQRSTGDLDRKGVIGSHSFRSTGSTSSWMSSESNYAGGHPGSVMSEGSQASFVVEVNIGPVSDQDWLTYFAPTFCVLIKLMIDSTV